MSTLSLTLPEIGQPDKTQDPKINTAFTTIQTTINGLLDSSNMNNSANQFFPKLLAAGNRHLNFGAVTSPGSAANTPGGVGAFGNLGTHVAGTFNHELGVTPAVVILTAAEQQATVISGSEYQATPVFGVVGVSATIVEYQGNIYGTQSSRNWKFYWLAIG